MATKKSPVKAAYWLAEENNVFSASQINVPLFTHLFCGFATVNSLSYRVELPSPKERFTSFCKIVKEKKSDMKTILSIECKNPAFPGNNAGRTAFIDSAIELAKKCHFDGIDLYCSSPGCQLEMEKLGKLIDDLRKAIGKEATLLLTAAVYLSPNIGASTYPIDALKKLDWVNVTAYRLTDPSQSPHATAAPAPLFTLSEPSVSKGVEQWLLAGLPANHLVLGLPFFGYAWKLIEHPKGHEIGAPAAGPYAPPPEGLETYKEIKNLVDRGFNHGFDATHVTDFCYLDRMWIGYDGPDTVRAKIIFARTSKLLGYFAWTVGRDSENCELAAAAFKSWG